MQKLTVNLGVNSYDILIERGIIKDFKNYTDPKRRYFIISNHTVFKLYGEHFKDFETILIKDGEKYKNFETYKFILDKLLEAKIQRTDVIVALGGGVVGDIAGYAAATCLRGVDFIQIPTTLLAQTDSSVGGKVAINHKTGKNLIGSFWQPKLVLIDPDTLKTLEDRQIKTGLAEVVKYAFIEKNCNPEGEASFFDFLLGADICNLPFEDIIYRSCFLKAKVVERDERENDLRRVLNLGHTWGHAIEKITNYKKYTHGEAVIMGIKIAFRVAFLKGLIKEETVLRATKLFEKFSLDTVLDKKYKKQDIINALKNDKKVKFGKINFVLPKEINSVGIFQDIDETLIKESLP